MLLRVGMSESHTSGMYYRLTHRLFVFISALSTSHKTCYCLLSSYQDKGNQANKKSTKFKLSSREESQKPRSTTIQEPWESKVYFPPPTSRNIAASRLVIPPIPFLHLVIFSLQSFRGPGNATMLTISA